MCSSICASCSVSMRWAGGAVGGLSESTKKKLRKWDEGVGWGRGYG